MSIETDYATLRRVLHEHESDLIGGWAAEFGVYTGYSLGIIADKMPVIGFDSFEGLPEDWREGFPKGKFGRGDKPSLGLNLLPPANAMIVPGWFEDTVPTFPFPQLDLVHIDCDLYSSTVTALAGITPYVDVSTVIVLDEYQNYPGAEQHEQRAFQQWCAEHLITVECIASGEGKHAQEAAFIIHDIGTY